MQSVLTIAGSDPTGGAGLQADLQVFHAFGVHGAAVPTALTVQDGLHVRQVLPVFPSVLLDQLRATLAAVQPDAIKIGMLGSDDIVRNVILALASTTAAAGAAAKGVPIVIDPVLAASDGTPLLERRAHRALQDLIQGRCLLTPNWPEAEVLVGRELPRRRDAERGMQELLEDRQLDAILLKGGHRETDCDDLLVMREGDEAKGEIACEWLKGERLPGDPVHGTGCVLSAAIAAGLASGRGLYDAIGDARDFVQRAIAGATRLPNGARIPAFS